MQPLKTKHSTQTSVLSGFPQFFENSIGSQLVDISKKNSAINNWKSQFHKDYLLKQGSTNCAHGDERACKEVFECTKLHARKSIKTLLSSTWISFKVASCFCVWKQIILDTTRSDIHNNLSAEKFLLNIVISSVT